MFCTRGAWVCLVCLWLCKEEGSSPVSAITEKRDFGMGTMLTNFYMCGMMLFQHAREECESKRGLCVLGA